MQLDATLDGPVEETKSEAAALEAAGFDGVLTGETRHDPFLRLLQAAESTERVMLGTSIAIAFGRTPLTVAHAGHDLARYTGGRFVLGLGSQVKPHIERRFSMPWSRPADRMREFVLAVRAIWDTWQNGTPLAFDGEFYNHTLMTPFFSPSAIDVGPPPIHLAGVGRRMTEVAGEVCDGFLVHPFTTRAYLDEVTVPALERGRAAAGEDGLGDFVMSGRAFVAIGRDESELRAAIDGTKRQIAFYASTPAYVGVLERHGFAELQPELTRMTKQGEWDRMAAAVPDELVELIAVVGDPETVGRGVVARWGDTYDRMSLYVNHAIEPEVLTATVAAVRDA